MDSWTLEDTLGCVPGPSGRRVALSLPTWVLLASPPESFEPSWETQSRWGFKSTWLLTLISLDCLCPSVSNRWRVAAWCWPSEKWYSTQVTPRKLEEHQPCGAREQKLHPWEGRVGGTKPGWSEWHRARPSGAPGTRPLCSPFCDYREQPSVSLHDLPWVPAGRFKQLLTWERRRGETREKQSRAALGQGPGFPSMDTYSHVFELFCSRLKTL